MPVWFSQLRNLIWTSVTAVAAGILSVGAAVRGASLEVVVGFGALGVIMALLSPKS